MVFVVQYIRCVYNIFCCTISSTPIGLNDSPNIMNKKDGENMDSPEKWNSEEKRLERKERLNSLKTKDGGKAPIKQSRPFLHIFLPIIAAVLVLSLGLWSAIYFALPQKIFAPMSIGGNKVSNVEFSYYYTSALQQLQIDTTTAEGQAKLKAKCTETGFTDKTWNDFAYDLTAKSIVEVQIQYELAKAANFTLNEEELSAVDEVFDSLVTQAGSTEAADDYLIKMFGNGVTMATLKPVYTKQTLATKYSKDAITKIAVTDQEIADQYNSNKDTYDTVTFRLVFFEAEVKTDGTTATVAETEAFDAKAKTDAEAFLAKVTDEASYKTLAAEKIAADKVVAAAKTAAQDKAAYDKMTDAEKKTADETKASTAAAKAAEDKAKADVIAAMTTDEKAAYDNGLEKDDITLLKSLLKSQIDNASADMGTWMFDASRKAGDKKAFSAQGGYYAIYFVTRDGSETLPTVRHILVSPNKEKEVRSGDVFTVEEWNTGRTAAQALLKQATSLDKFIELVKANTTDTASAETGGLYKDIKPGEMMAEFNNWCFDPARKPGDQDIVRTSYGYHIVRFIENKATTALSRNSETIKTELGQKKYLAQLDEKKALSQYQYKISDFGITVFKWGIKLPEVSAT